MNLIHIGIALAFIALAAIVWMEDRNDKHG